MTLVRSLCTCCRVCRPSRAARSGPRHTSTVTFLARGVSLKHGRGRFKYASRGSVGTKALGCSRTVKADMRTLFNVNKRLGMHETETERLQMVRSQVGLELRNTSGSMLRRSTQTLSRLARSLQHLAAAQSHIIGGKAKAPLTTRWATSRHIYGKSAELWIFSCGSFAGNPQQQF